MRADNDMVSCFEQCIQYGRSIPFQNAAVSPGRSEKNGPRASLLLGRGGVQSLFHFIHIGNANQLQFLLRQSPQLFKLSNLLHLILTREQNGVIVVNAKHAVECNIIGSVRNVNIP